MAGELWTEVRRRAKGMTGRAEKFQHDLQTYIRFKKECDGVSLSVDDVNFEEFLGFLDVEYHLGLRGSDTWSADGNETQVIAKTLIGQILTERMPPRHKLPGLYLDFANKLRPGDYVLTFNYDLILERALEAVGKPFRLFPQRYERLGSGGGATVDSSNRSDSESRSEIAWFHRLV
jgi:hypothetical protein